MRLPKSFLHAARLAVVCATAMILSLGATPSGASVPQTTGMVGSLSIHYVRPGDTMLDIAMRYRIGYVELRAANPDVDPWLPIEDTVLLLPEQHILPKDAGPGLLVNLGDLRLYFFPPDGGAPQSWPISTGREAYETPLGLQTVTEKTVNPTWVPTANHRSEDPTVPAYVPPGPDNPLGNRRIRVGWNGYAIHGTNKPEGIGRRVSRGCVRMYPTDVEEVFELVRVGMPVTITNQPVKLGWRDDNLYMEVHPFGDQADQVEYGDEVLPQPIGNVDDLVFDAAGVDIGRVNWDTVRAAVAERRGVPIRITE